MGQEIPKSYINALLKALRRGRNKDVHQATSQALVQLGQEVPQSYIDALLKTLENEDWLVRYYAIQALGQLGQKNSTVIDALFKVLEDFGDKDDQFVLQATVKALGSLKQGTEVVIDALLQVLRDKNGHISLSDAIALAELGQEIPQSYITLLMEAASSYNDKGVCQAAVRALVHLKQGTELVIKVLLKMLRYKGFLLERLAQGYNEALSNIREYATQTLAQLVQENPNAIGALLEVLRDKHDVARPSVVCALETLKQPTEAVINALLHALGDKEEYVRRFATIMLGQLCSPLCRWTKLKQWAIDNTFVPALGTELSAELTKRIFFFVGEDNRSTHALPCVSKDWKRLQVFPLKNRQKPCKH